MIKVDGTAMMANVEVGYLEPVTIRHSKSGRAIRKIAVIRNMPNNPKHNQPCFLVTYYLVNQNMNAYPVERYIVDKKDRVWGPYERSYRVERTSIICRNIGSNRIIKGYLIKSDESLVITRTLKVIRDWVNQNQI